MAAEKLVTTIASTSATTPADVVSSIVLGKQVGGAYPVPDAEWAAFASFFKFDPTKLDAFSPLTGPYAGKSFVKQSQVIQPGLGAAADAGANVAGGAAASALDATGLGQIWTALTNPSNWLRALEIIGAAVAIYLGIRGLAEGYGS
jgi:hypothetical protein